MADYKCPNCGQFKYKKDWPVTTSGGWSLTGLAMAIALTAAIFGLHEIVSTVIFLVGIGLVIGGWMYRMAYPPKTASYTCENCQYTARHSLE